MIGRFDPLCLFLLFFQSDPLVFVVIIIMCFELQSSRAVERRSKFKGLYYYYYYYLLTFIIVFKFSSLTVDI